MGIFKSKKTKQLQKREKELMHEFEVAHKTIEELQDYIKKQHDIIDRLSEEIESTVKRDPKTGRFTKN